ncbi:DUF6470 family protein [Metabacillus idriensis]|uniref:DUF6470 family protein n=1 Tax=Metabacillus idriensis TaxID=324768 RepID=UPI0008A91CDD|nr:DUF6470 family protein [Metabacillus idriensis]MCM3598492.1 DUF6470 family protein [Metabacillus idriensis]OHR74526.1 hypothetical protein HMPREF3291_17780 [Bacillus sp. HMSC76G11]
MNIPQIRLESRFAKLGLETFNATLAIQQPKADLSIQQPKAELSIQTTPGKLTIDQTKAREDVDLKHISKRIAEAADQGRQDVLAGIARRIQQGDEQMRIENGGRPLTAQAKKNSEREIKQFNIGFIPSHFSVKLDYQPAEVKIDVQRNAPIIESKTHKPILDYQAGEVKVELAERNQLKIDFVSIDKKI